MTGHPVSTLVNKASNDDERCLERVESENSGSGGELL